MKYLFIICFLFQIYSISANAQSYKYHTVKKGETVFSISQSYSIDEEDIYKYNPGAREGIGVNEKLVIPIKETSSAVSAKQNTSSNPQFIEHTVKKKETLYSLSKEYNVSIDEIKRYNKQLYSKELQMGETVRIPSGSSAVQSSVVTQNTPPSKPVETNKPQENQITKTREHIVLPKETKYGIARKYGMTVKELESLNPRVEVLQPGMMIRVGVDVLDDEPVIITDDRFRFYEVKPQETLYSLSQRFGVSQDSLKELNPALKEGLKFGMVLKVPAKDKEGKEISDEDAYTGKGENADTKMDLSQFIDNRSTKEIVLMLPYHLNMVDADSLETYRNTILNERVVRISLDFYSGVLMAVDKAKSMGISTNLKVYDTNRNTSEVANIINSNNFNNVDAVIGPLLQETTEAAASRLESKNIPVINPLSNRRMRGFRNLFQSRPGDDFMRSAMIDYIVKNSPGKNVIIVADGKSFQIKNELNNLLPSARTVNPTDNFVSEEKLAQMMTEGKNWVILESDNINVVSSTTSALNRLARNHDVTLLTTDKNNAYESDIISNNHLGKLKFHYPSVDKEYDTEASEEFIKQYEERYNIEPNQYAIRGYDLTMDVLLRLASAEDLYESFEKYPGYTEYYESKFHYMPNSDGGGYTNDAIYILQMNEDLTISKANDF